MIFEIILQKFKEVFTQEDLHCVLRLDLGVTREWPTISRFS